MMNDLRNEFVTHEGSLGALADAVLERTQYIERLSADGSHESQERIENLLELTGSIKDYEGDVTAREGTPPTIHDYLEQVSLVAPADAAQKGVTLMTVHAAKGLEFPVVFVTGLEDGVFPSLRNGEDEAALAEERRLAYVAITRAEERLFLTNARHRRLFGQDARPFVESRFLGDIPDHCIARPVNQPKPRPSWMDRSSRWGSSRDATGAEIAESGFRNSGMRNDRARQRDLGRVRGGRGWLRRRREHLPTGTARAPSQVRRGRGARLHRHRQRPQAHGLLPVGGTEDHRRPLRGADLKGLRARVRELFAALLHEHTAPGRLAAAVLVGCIVGCTPLFGLHIVVCIALAYALGLNKLVVYGAANLSIPPLVPFIGFASVQLGERLLHGGWLGLRRADFALAHVRTLAKAFFVDWMVGGVTLGAAIGLVAGALTWLALARRRAHRRRTADAIGAAIEVARRRYDGLHPRFKWYARMKYVMDPCYRAIAPLVPAGRLRGRSRQRPRHAAGAARRARRRAARARHRVGPQQGRLRRARRARPARLDVVAIVEGDARSGRDSALRRHHARRHAALLGRRRAARAACHAVARRCAPADACWCAKAIRRVAAARALPAPSRRW